MAVDSSFFESLPPIRTVEGFENSEITWLSYPFQRNKEAYRMGEPSVAFTLWDDVAAALREGTAPKPREILAELDRSIQAGRCRIIGG